MHSWVLECENARRHGHGGGTPVCWEIIPAKQQRIDSPSHTGLAYGQKAFPVTHPNLLKHLRKPWQPRQAGNPAGRTKRGADDPQHPQRNAAPLHRCGEAEASAALDTTVELRRQLSKAKNDLPDDIPPRAHACLYDPVVAALFKVLRSSDYSPALPDAADRPTPHPQGTGVAPRGTRSHARGSLFPMRGGSPLQPAAHDPSGLRANPPLTLSPQRKTSG
jgi:hypothetical protein